MKCKILFIIILFGKSAFCQGLEGKYAPTFKNMSFSLLHIFQKNHKFTYFISGEFVGRQTFEGDWGIRKGHVKLHILSPFNSDSLIKTDRMEEYYIDTLPPLQNKIQLIASDINPYFIGSIFINDDSIPLTINRDAVGYTTQKIDSIRVEGDFARARYFKIQNTKQNFFKIFIYDKELIPEIYFRPFLEFLISSSRKTLYPIVDGKILKYFGFKKWKLKISSIAE